MSTYNTFTLGKYRGFIFENRNIFRNILLVFLAILVVLTFFFRYYLHSGLSTADYISLHLLAMSIESYTVPVTSFVIILLITIWLCVPLYVLHFSKSYKYRSAYIIRKRGSLFRENLIIILTNVLLCLSFYFIFLDIFTLFAYWGIDTKNTSLISILFSVFASFCSIYSALPQTNLFFNQDHSYPELVDFPEIFSQRTKVIYLNVGSLAPRLAIVFDTLNIWNKYVEKYTPTSEVISSVIQPCENQLYGSIVRKIQNDTWEGSEYLRNSISNYIGIQKPENIVFLTNTSRAIEIVLEAIRPTYVVTTDHEHESQKQFFSIIKNRHNTQIMPVEVVKEKWKDDINESKESFTRRFIQEVIEDYSGRLEKEVFVVFLSHVCSSTGWVLPVEDICRKIKDHNPNITIVIDGAHAVGNIEVNISNLACDYYIFCGHKWLFGSPSLGILVFNNKNFKKNLIIAEEVHEFLALSPQFLDSAMKCHSIGSREISYFKNFKSTICLSPLISLTITLDEFHTDISREHIRNNMRSINEYLCRKISEIPEYIVYENVYFPSSPGIFILQYKTCRDQDTALSSLVTDLESKNIIVKKVLSPSLGYCIRICIPFYIRFNDLKRIYDAFYECRIPKTTIS